VRRVEEVRLLSEDEVENLPAPEWLIEGLIGANGIAVVYGKPGEGKSFLALTGRSISRGVCRGMAVP
jgi:Mrp family chromosome partitioning ATPase